MTDQEVLPLFAKMLPDVTINGEAVTESTPFGVRNIEWYGLLYLCHRIEEGMTDGEKINFMDALPKYINPNYPKPGAETDDDILWEFTLAPWQARVQAAAKVKGLI